MTDDELMELGEQVYYRAENFMFDGRPLTNMEMYAQRQWLATRGAVRLACHANLCDIQMYLEKLKEQTND
jgi:hypothetical protein